MRASSDDPAYVAGYDDGFQAAAALIDAALARAVGPLMPQYVEPDLILDPLYEAFEDAGFQLGAWRAGGPGMPPPDLTLFPMPAAEPAAT